MQTVQIHDGQCGLCGHFGEHHMSQVLVSIHSSKKADEAMLDECGHPKHAALHLKVTPISGCDGLVPAAEA
jgi:hypothetical protein